MFEIIPNWHPIFVHFTVALLSLSVGLFVVSQFAGGQLKEQWQIVAKWCLWFGAGITIITALTGIYAYNTVAHDTPSHLAMTEHRNWAIVTIGVFLMLAIWSIIRVKKSQPLSGAFVVAMIVAGGLLSSTAWHGGEVVYRYGLGVMSLPEAEGEGHNHSHGDGGGDHHGGEGESLMDHHAGEEMGHDNSDGHHDDVSETPTDHHADEVSVHDDGHEHSH